MKLYRVMYRFKDDGDNWHEKSPDVNGFYENGHYRAVEMDEAIRVSERLTKRLRKFEGEYAFEVKIVEANENSYPLRHPA